MSENDVAVLEARSLTKSFGGIAAVENVSFKVAAGEVVCLLGDNGAGKSTLIKMLSGVHRPSSGQIFIDGAPVTLHSPRAAKVFGIATVHQDVGAIELLSVTRNFFLGSELTKGWGPFRRLDHRRAEDIVLQQVAALGIRRVRDGSQPIGGMSGGEKQALAIARAIYFGGRILILDEPTSALGVKEAAIVLKLIDRAREDGLAVILITHNVHHAIAVGDHYVVLSHGKAAADFRRGARSRTEIIDLMAGGERLQDASSAVG